MLGDPVGSYFRVTVPLFITALLKVPVRALIESYCCLMLNNRMIPLKQVVSYSWTSSNCAKRAIVFKTVAGREICVDPEMTWVSHLKSLMLMKPAFI
uniref:C-C motif chemokine n=1 Tax=Sinocyclocheilus rhinocerous TaxID=307959 RepID=A0A673JL99_9TELE